MAWIMGSLESPAITRGYIRLCDGAYVITDACLSRLNLTREPLTTTMPSPLSDSAPTEVILEILCYLDIPSFLCIHMVFPRVARRITPHLARHITRTY